MLYLRNGLAIQRKSGSFEYIEFQPLTVNNKNEFISSIIYNHLLDNIKALESSRDTLVIDYEMLSHPGLWNSLDGLKIFNNIVLDTSILASQIIIQNFTILDLYNNKIAIYRIQKNSNRHSNVNYYSYDISQIFEKEFSKFINAGKTIQDVLELLSSYPQLAELDKNLKNCFGDLVPEEVNFYEFDTKFKSVFNKELEIIHFIKLLYLAIANCIQKYLPEVSNIYLKTPLNQLSIFRIASDNIAFPIDLDYIFSNQIFIEEKIQKSIYSERFIIESNANELKINTGLNNHIIDLSTLKKQILNNSFQYGTLSLTQIELNLYESMCGDTTIELSPLNSEKFYSYDFRRN